MNTDKYKTKLRVGIIAVCVLLVFGITITLVVSDRTRREPEYAGKKLIQWIEELKTGRTDWVRMTPVVNVNAVEAIRSMSESATPFLVTELQQSLRCQQLCKLLDIMLKSLSGKREAAARRFYLAVAGLEALGDKATDAIPVMTNLLHEDSTAFQAAYVLAAIGSAAVPVLSNALISTNSKISAAAVHSSGVLGKSGEPLIPLLLNVFTNSRQDRVTRSSAARALGMIGQAPETVLPVLEAGLRDNDYIARRGAAFGLLLMDRDSTRLTPALETALKTPSGKLDQWILMALVCMSADDLHVATALAEAFTFRGSNSPITKAETGFGVNPEWAQVFANFRAITNITNQQLSAARKALVQMGLEEGVE